MTIRYVYAFHCERQGDEVFFRFPRFPEIISAVPFEFFESWDQVARQSHADDAVITALQTIILTRDTIPPVDDSRLVTAAGFVHLSPVQCMKLQLARVFAENCSSVAEFARTIDKQDTGARRLLNLRHRSTPDEIEQALAVFRKRLVHQWEVEGDSDQIVTLDRVFA